MWSLFRAGSQSTTVWRLDTVVFPGLERGRRHREVLHRQPGRIEQRHRVRPRAAGRVAGEDRAQLGHAVAGHQPRVDRAGQLAAVRGLLPFVAEQRARRDRADARLRLARAVGAEHVEVKAGVQAADVDHDLGARRHAADHVAAERLVARSGAPFELVREHVGDVGTRVVAHARAVACRRQAPCRPCAVQPASDDADGPRAVASQRHRRHRRHRAGPQRGHRAGIHQHQRLAVLGARQADHAGHGRQSAARDCPGTRSPT